MSTQPPPAPDRLAADLRATVSTLVRATRSADRLAPIPATVLDLLDRNGPMTTADLAAGRGVRHQTMAATVRELTGLGHVTASPDPSDARKRLLALTPTGRTALAADRRARVALLSEAITTALSPDDRRTLAAALPVLDRLAAALASDGAPAREPATGPW